MHILVATDGALPAERAAEAVARFYREGDEVAVLTVLNIPTEFLAKLGESGVREAAVIANEAGQGLGDRAAEQLAVIRPVGAEPASDSTVLRALARTAAERTEPVVDALAALSVPSKPTWATTDNRTARTVLTAALKNNTALLVIGSHGQGRFDGLLGSTGTKLVRKARCDVLVIRTT